MSEPRKHHFVPQFMLRRFADEPGRLIVHSTVAERQYPSSVRDVGHQNDGHTVFRRDGTPDRKSLEGAMSKIEGEAATAIDALTDGARLDDDRQETLAWFLALQWYRSRGVLNALAAGVRDRGSLTPQEFQTGLLRAVMVPFFSAWHNRDNMTGRYKDGWDFVVSATDSFVWSLCRYRDDSLVLGDQTGCLWGTRPGATQGVNEAWAHHGVGISWPDVKRVTMPLTPRLGLLLTRPEAPTRLTAAAFNRATIYNAHQFVVHAPTWGIERNALTQAFDESLEIQRRVAPAFFKNQF